MTQANADPIVTFQKWFQEAESQESTLPEAAALATITPDGFPRVRVVLIKSFSSSGFDFFTNYKSQKALDIEHLPRASLGFHWKSMERQIRIDGSIRQLESTLSDRYWSMRPRGSQIAAWASDQSCPIETREVLNERFEIMRNRFPEGPIPRPDFWGGYRLIPQQIEFWQGQMNRLHDRLVFTRTDSGHWNRQRVQP
ncbi:MAG: pyridoxamine 5'-phosphate oxidase [Planctomycetota bacterium]|jgi:pyridoxamine 5'-phosphate oxidase|nr:pyridoxamine 5'-phosphate oxidase [Planctomycetota bacterium]